MERTDLPGRAVWRPLFVAPLAIPAFVNSYAWVGVIPSLHGLWAGVLITTLSYFPFMYLPVAATLRRLDPAVEESARALGSDSAGVFFRVVLPQLRLAILGGGLLIGVHLLAEYGAFAMLRFDTFTVAIFQQFQVTFDGAAGSMLAGVLVLLCLVLLLAEAGARGKARYARIGCRRATRRGSGSSAPQRRFPRRPASRYSPLLALGVPVWTIMRWLWIGGTSVWALRRDRQRAGPDHRAGRTGGRADDGAGLPLRVGGRPVERGAGARRRGRQLRHQFASRDRHRAGVGHRRHPLRPPALPDRGR